MFKTHRNMSRTARVLEQLKKSGYRGSFNHELARVGGLAWHRRVTDLRKEGYLISAIRIDGGTFKYFYDPKDED